MSTRADPEAVKAVLRDHRRDVVQWSHETPADLSGSARPRRKTETSAKRNVLHPVKHGGGSVSLGTRNPR